MTSNSSLVRRGIETQNTASRSPWWPRLARKVFEDAYLVPCSDGLARASTDVDRRGATMHESAVRLPPWEFVGFSFWTDSTFRFAGCDRRAKRSHSIDLRSAGP